MSSTYADSSQARELDLRFESNGNPVVIQPEDIFHDYKAVLVAKRKSEAAYRKHLASRIECALDQMEVICPPTLGSAP